MTAYISHALGSADKGNLPVSTVKFFGSHTQDFTQSLFKSAGRIFKTLYRIAPSLSRPLALSHEPFLLCSPTCQRFSFAAFFHHTLGQSFSQILDLPRA